MRLYPCQFSHRGRDTSAPSVRAWAVSVSSDQLSSRDLKPFSPGGTELLSSCMVPGSTTRASTYGETLGWMR